MRAQAATLARRRVPSNEGHWAPEVEVAFARARELCEQIGDAPEFVPTLFGLWRAYVVQMEDVEQAREVAGQLLRQIGDETDPVPFVVAHYAAAYTCIMVAEFSAAREHLRKAIGRYSVGDRPRAEVYRFGQDPGVACRSYLAMTEWLLGDPHSAREQGRDRLALAERLDDPFTLAYAFAFAALLDQLQDDRKGIMEKAKEAIRISSEKGFPFWLSIGKVMEGWGQAIASPSSRTVQSLRKRVADHRALGTNVLVPYFLALLGDAALRAGQIRACGASLDEAATVSTRTGERWYDTEVLRLRTELLLARDGPFAEAETLFRDALSISRDGEAKFFELRTGTSLARMLQKQGRYDESHELLAPICASFPQGLDTAHIRTARSLLSEVETGHDRHVAD